MDCRLIVCSNLLVFLGFCIQSNSAGFSKEPNQNISVLKSGGSFLFFGSLVRLMTPPIH